MAWQCNDCGRFIKTEDAKPAYDAVDQTWWTNAKCPPGKGCNKPEPAQEATP